ncbi:MarR family transcriptional regulator [Nonomuraea wenchangensis]|uniref:MarR family transcriptional regulator n=1 Tax=Nonomuraea wenchangensis TaxID=568860 RepID=UPI0037B83727
MAHGDPGRPADSGPRSQRDLAVTLAIDPSDVTKVLDELVSAGHVERTRDPRDRRRIHVKLTPAGSDALADCQRSRKKCWRLWTPRSVPSSTPC